MGTHLDILPFLVGLMAAPSLRGWGETRLHLELCWTLTVVSNTTAPPPPWSSLALSFCLAVMASGAIFKAHCVWQTEVGKSRHLPKDCHPD